MIKIERIQNGWTVSLISLNSLIAETTFCKTKEEVLKEVGELIDILPKKRFLEK